jgi:uroporphyrin-III C-methyltransferase
MGIPLGKVYLVGAGPGDPDLITLKGKKCLEEAEVVFYDRLVGEELLEYAPESAELVYVGKRASQPCAYQTSIETLLIERARHGQRVVRLKGGDPFVFGRGGEEAEALRRAGIPYEIVPGVSSAVAVPAYAGIPLTHRACASSVAIVTGHNTSSNDGHVKWSALSRSVDTLVILMGLHGLRGIMSRLLENGCDPRRPVALIQSGTRRSQRSVVGTVETIADLAETKKFQSPTVVVVGEVVKLGRDLQWFHEAVLERGLEFEKVAENTPETRI